MPTDPDTGKPYTHENYSAAIVSLLQDVIENHPRTRITRLLQGKWPISSMGDQLQVAVCCGVSFL